MQVGEVFGLGFFGYQVYCVVGIVVFVKVGGWFFEDFYVFDGGVVWGVYIVVVGVEVVVVEF